MSDPTSEFFAELSAREHVPMLRGISGTLRFDLEHDKHVDHWYVTIHRGDVTVTRDAGEADCVVAASRELFDRMAAGTANATAAALRGLAESVGDLRLIIQFQRLFPGPPPEGEPRAEAGYARRMSS